MEMDLKQDLCYIDDLIRGLVNLMSSDYDKPVNIETR